MKGIVRHLLFFLTLLYLMVRGNTKGKNNVSTKTWVVINQTPNIGDMICTTPVFRAIKNQYPDSEVIVVGTPKNRIILEGNKDVDLYIDNTSSAWSLIMLLRKRKIDVGILVNPSAIDFALLFLGGVRSISGFGFVDSYKGRESKSYTIISGLGIRVSYYPGEYVPVQYLQLLKPLGISSENGSKHLSYSNEAKESVMSALKGQGFDKEVKIVAIAPGAGTKIKQWPASRFGQVANFLHRKYGIATVIIGGPKDVQEVEGMIESLEADTVYCNLAGQNLDELKATLSAVCLIIGNDSGPIYIAESFGAATVVLIGPTDEGEHPMQDETHRIIKAKNRGKALLQSHLSSEDTIDLDAARSQIEAISVEEVYRELDDLLPRLKIEVIK